MRGVHLKKHRSNDAQLAVLAPFLTFLLRRKGDTNGHCWTSLEWALPDITGAQMGASCFTNASGSSRRLQRQSGSPRRDEMVSRSVSQTRRHFTPDNYCSKRTAIKFTTLYSIRKMGVAPIFLRIGRETNRRKRDNSPPDSATPYPVCEFATKVLRHCKQTSSAHQASKAWGPTPGPWGQKRTWSRGKFGCFGCQLFYAKRRGPLQPSTF